MTRPAWQLDFDCSGCGACCRAVGCSFLSGNRCTIYSRRPDVCRVGYSFDPQVMTVKEYLDLSRQACKELEARFPPKETPPDGVRLLQS